MENFGPLFITRLQAIEVNYSFASINFLAW